MPRIASPYLRVGLVWLAMLVIWLLLPFLRDLILASEPGRYSLAGHNLNAFLATTVAVPFVAATCRALDNRSVKSLGLDMSLVSAKFFAVGVLAYLLPAALGFAVVLGLGWAKVVPLAAVSEIMLFPPTADSSRVLFRGAS